MVTVDQLEGLLQQLLTKAQDTFCPLEDAAEYLATTRRRGEGANSMQPYREMMGSLRPTCLCIYGNHWIRISSSKRELVFYVHCHALSAACSLRHNTGAELAAYE